MRNRRAVATAGQRQETIDPAHPDISLSTDEQRIRRLVTLAFAPMHKAAFGVAAGTVTALVVAAATILDYVLDPRRLVGLELLAEYFYGYTVSPTGAVIGLAWGFGVGFVAGWFVAFARNVLLAAWVLYFRAHADWDATNEFIDYV